MIDKPKNEILPKYLTGKRYFSESQSQIIDKNLHQYNLDGFWNQKELRKQASKMDIENVLEGKYIS